MPQSPLQIERDRGIVQVRFNRPSVLNALNVELALSLAEACRSLSIEPMYVELSGVGRAFMVDGAP